MLKAGETLVTGDVIMDSTDQSTDLQRQDVTAAAELTPHIVSCRSCCCPRLDHCRGKWGRLLSPSFSPSGWNGKDKEVECMDHAGLQNASTQFAPSLKMRIASFQFQPSEYHHFNFLFLK